MINSILVLLTSHIITDVTGITYPGRIAFTVMYRWLSEDARVAVN